jgi:acyl carrier protein
MDEVRARLLKCFRIVFPQLSDGEAATVSQHAFPAWDSVAAITLVNVVEEEFEIEMDLDAIGDLDSFDKVLGYVEGILQIRRS